jgi:GGDEF domain-containing protein
MLSRLPNPYVAQQLAQKLVDTLSRPFFMRGKRIGISASIGIAIYPVDGEQADILLAKADKAMYRAKCLGGNAYQFYTTGLRRTGPEAEIQPGDV